MKSERVVLWRKLEETYDVSMVQSEMKVYPDIRGIIEAHFPERVDLLEEISQGVLDEHEAGNILMEHELHAFEHEGEFIYCEAWEHN